MNNDYSPEYLQFCENMANEMNIQAMKYCNPANATTESVAKMEIAKMAFFATNQMVSIIPNGVTSLVSE